MTFSIATLSLAAVSYLLLLFLIAYAAERWLPERFSHHPLIYVLSLGVYATTWSYYGSVGFAAHQGILFLTIYLGVTLAFILLPVLLLPLLRLVRTHQLTSVADLFAFRFHSQLAGVLVTLMTLTGILPYIALQIRGVAEATEVLAPNASPVPTAVGFCVLISVFAIIFGVRHVTPREKHVGLVVAIAFESLVKLVALVTLAVVGVWLAFGGPGGMERWLRADPQRLKDFFQPGLDGPWGSLLLMSFAAGFLLPRQFHMIFTENLRPRALLSAGWGFPLFLLLLSLAVPPILWAGQALGLEIAPDYFVIGLARLSESPLLVMLIYLGGISAASAMIIVETLALSSMSLNHLVLPFLKPRPRRNLYSDLRWLRRAMIVALIAAGYGFYAALERSAGLVSWGLISFLAMAQLLPGIIGVLYWPRATGTGFIAGLLGGGIVWGLGALLPALTGINALLWLGLPGAGGGSTYSALAFYSLSVNVLLFGVFSLLAPPSAREREAADACREVGLHLPGGALRLESPAEFMQQLSPVTGKRAARLEVDKALADLGLDWDERRGEKLRLLRDQIERNLSGMMGPVLARMIVDRRLQLDQDARAALAQNVRLIEERLENSRRSFHGIAAELDALRRYHRQVLEDLPLGIVAVAAEERIVRWNPAMARLTGIGADEALGTAVTALPAPWRELLRDFLAEPAAKLYKRSIRRGTDVRFLSLHKAFSAEAGNDEQLLLVEDLTERELLERELAHSERLASIGRLAAGVAHEIGNPVTAIACLAQDLRQESDLAAMHQAAEQVLAQTHRIGNIVHTLVSYAHGGSTGAQPAPVQLRDAAEEARRVVQLSRRAQQMQFHNTLPTDLCVYGDGQRLVQVFVNLFSNTADACQAGGRVRISAHRLERAVQVTVSDDGPGIPEAIRDKVLEPFFTTKPAGQGTGLGLPLVYNIIKEHGGELRLESSDTGTRVQFELPLADVPVALEE
jgi:PAS domain S-box-containing protein